MKRKSAAAMRAEEGRVRREAELALMRGAKKEGNANAFAMVTRSQDARWRLEWEMAAERVRVRQGGERIALEKGRLELERERAALEVEQFRFDAAREVEQRAEELRAIVRDGGLSLDEKIEEVRLLLWGSEAARTPEEMARAEQRGREEE